MDDDSAPLLAAVEAGNITVYGLIDVVCGTRYERAAAFLKQRFGATFAIAQEAVKAAEEAEGHAPDAAQAREAA